MTYTDRQLRNIVVFVIVAARFALVISGAVIVVVCMREIHSGALISVPGIAVR